LKIGQRRFSTPCRVDRDSCMEGYGYRIGYRIGYTLLRGVSTEYNKSFNYNYL
jgi:hypothetical protein